MQPPLCLSLIHIYYSGLLEQFLKSEQFHKNTRGDVIWASKRYFSWLMAEGFETLDSVGVVQIQKYLCECHDHLKETSIHNILLYLKKLYRFLKDSGYSDHDYKELLSMKICRESKVLPAAAPEDVAAVSYTHLSRCRPPAWARCSRLSEGMQTPFRARSRPLPPFR